MTKELRQKREEYAERMMHQHCKARYPESTISKTTYEVIFLEGYKAGLITNRL